MLEDAPDLARLNRVLVIKLRHHGDVLLSSPVFSVLRNHAPHLKIDALIYRDTADMLSLHPAINEIHWVDRGWKRAGPRRQLREETALLGRLRARRYDLIIHLSEHPRGAWIRLLSGARYGVAPKSPGRIGWKQAFTFRYSWPAGNTRHTVEAHLDALRRLGIQPSIGERKLVLEPGSEARQHVEALLDRHGLGEKAFIHLHPTSRWLFKCWTEEKMRELVGQLQGAGHSVVLTAAPDPRELAMRERILHGLPRPVIDLAGQLTLKQLAALTAKARLFIGVDSAPMHIAAAMGTPVVALFGPSGEHEWGPWMVPHRIITSQHTCRPCGQDGCGGGKISECLTTLPVDRVWGAVQELLAGS